MKQLDWKSYAGTRTLRAEQNGFAYILQLDEALLWGAMICFGEGGKYCVTDEEDTFWIDDAKRQCQHHADAVSSAIEKSRE